MDIIIEVNGKQKHRFSPECPLGPGYHAGIRDFFFRIMAGAASVPAFVYTGGNA
jgi:hypothetical protein